jgi:hypothetical protein
MHRVAASQKSRSGATGLVNVDQDDRGSIECGDCGE